MEIIEAAPFRPVNGQAFLEFLDSPLTCDLGLHNIISQFGSDNGTSKMIFTKTLVTSNLKHYPTMKF